jgi:16S rRNA (cytosine967-C5)-methyltransferase
MLSTDFTPSLMVNDGSVNDGTAPRLAAATVLHSIIVQKIPLATALAQDTTFNHLPARDKPLSRMLLMTAIRHQGLLRSTLKEYLARPLPTTVTALLHIGLAECLLLETPAYASVSSIMHLMKKQPNFAAKVVNAVLRRALREKENLLATYGAPLQQWPLWLQQELIGSYGEEVVLAMAECCQRVPPLDITPLSPLPGGLFANYEPIPIGNVSIRLPFFTGAVESLPGYAEGLWQIQDMAAALPARLFGTALAGKRVLDVCAAPGGKTAQLAAAGAVVTALDSHAGRLQRLQANLQRLRLQASLVQSDARTWRAPQPFPFILLDAPCSATGTLRRHPDVAWLKHHKDIQTLATMQLSILRQMAQQLAPGGVLLYVVCSLLPREGEEVVNAFLAQEGKSYQRSPFQPQELADMHTMGEMVTSLGDLRTRPDRWREHGGMDGFYIARLTAKL